MARRFVKGVFSDRYLTTVGVKIDKRVVHLDGRETALIVWDLSGEDEFARLEPSYLRGASGYFLVADGTRPETLDQALALHERVQSQLGETPFELLLNKADLESEWRIPESAATALTGRGWRVSRTSAKSGAGVEAAFERLARAAPDHQSGAPS